MSDPQPGTPPTPAEDKFQRLMDDAIRKSRLKLHGRNKTQDDTATDDRPRATLTLSDVTAAARHGAVWGTVIGLVIVAVLGGLVGLLVGGLFYWFNER